MIAVGVAGTMVTGDPLWLSRAARECAACVIAQLQLARGLSAFLPLRHYSLSPVFSRSLAQRKH